MRLALTLTVLLLTLSAQRESPTPAAWKIVQPPFRTSFPRDHGAHEDYRTEWWYATGILQSNAGPERFGWQLTIFRQGLEPGAPAVGEPLLAPRQVYAGHFVLTDLASGRCVHAERTRRAVPGLASASAIDMDVVLDAWTMQRADDDSVHVVARDRDLDMAIDVVLRPAKPPVMHGTDGASIKGEGVGNASAYMSWTRLTTTGSITFGERAHAVHGESWFDHEWATSQLGRGVVGWDWFGLRLDDGRELMLYRLRRADGSATPESSATLVERDGTARHLRVDEFALAATSTWTSPHSKGVYPSAWRLEVPSIALDVAIAAEASDCEIDARTSTNTTYWEGPVRVEGSVRGAGYGELTGYAGSMEGRF